AYPLQRLACLIKDVLPLLFGVGHGSPHQLTLLTTCAPPVATAQAHRTRTLIAISSCWKKLTSGEATTPGVLTISFGVVPQISRLQRRLESRFRRRSSPAPTR